MTNGASSGGDLNFRDRVIEFIGTTTSTVKGFEKDIKEIKDDVKDNDDKNDKRLTAMERKLNDLKVEYTVTKTKIAIFSSLAGGAVVLLIKIVGMVAKALGGVDVP